MNLLPYEPFTPAELEQIALDIRKRPGCLDGWRFRIESFVEQQGFQIYPVEGLREEFGIEAYLGANRRIFVDEKLMNASSPRYFSTLLEEVVHSILHMPSDHNELVATPEEIRDAVAKMSDHEYAVMEKDAKYLVGAILMPKAEFSEQFHKHYADLKKRLKTHAFHHTLVRTTIRRLYQAYCVSLEAATFRAFALHLISRHDLNELSKYRPTEFNRASSI